jgi:leader peptidase (prepilin peptidase)/N-methyltransferase
MMMSNTVLWCYLITLAFCFGACVGSFLNVCIHRIPLDESVVTPRSKCPKCSRMIPWYDNVPLVSFLLLRARCRGCGTAISPRYFLVELLTAVLFTLVWSHYGVDLAARTFDPRTLVYWTMVGGLILGTFVDFEHMIIPDRVTIGGMILGPVLSFLVPSLHAGAEGRVEGLAASLTGLATGFGLLWVVGRLGKLAFKKDAMGFGDVKLLGAIGAFLGWRAVLFTVMFSSLIGSVVGVALIVTGNKKWQSRIPFGPYLAAAAVVWVLWGQGWWKAYVDFLINP